ncbi:hypothetical protein [Nostoc sp. UHCC 0251]|uniref:hypothetical protein n=1 Tax=Nostoc sp. UHCC 0251 TaxID=3110240 RepID=UPI002B207E87|nr:hypothetical protein [Nostoc sp. UHCC 0251]MEA5623340.1 hypothetical protein [Nostoc sp. UHCC 0251]
MDITVKKFVLRYETLANKAIKLNQSYLCLLNIYQELNFAPDLVSELDKSGNSPSKVIISMQKDQKVIQNNFTHLAGLIAKFQSYFTTNAEVEQLKAIAHDCQIMSNFIQSINLADLQQMFIKINYL